MFGLGKKNKKKSAVSMTEYVVRDGDHIVSIAQAHGMSWKDFAAYNEIEPPYVLVPGTVVHVPATANPEDSVKSRGDASSAQSSSQRVIGTPQHYVTPSTTDTAQDATTAAHSVPVVKQESGEHQDTRGTPVESIQDQRKGNVQVHMQEDLTDVATEGVVPPPDHSVQLPLHSDRDSTSSDHTAQRGKDRTQSSAAVSQKDPDAATQDTDAPERTIMYAPPESMIAQPASEPTTRAIDIEWMRDDEATYAEEMSKQQKRTNRWIILTVLLGLVIGGAVAFFVYFYLLPQATRDRVSLDALIRSQDVTPVAQEPTDNVQEDAVVAPADFLEEVTVEEQSPSTDQQAVSITPPHTNPADLTVQVLNAGGPAGAAGAVTQILKNHHYATRTAHNAKNHYTGTVIYYTAGKKADAEAVAQLLPATYGTPTVEESVSVTTTYTAMIVVVIGAQK